MLRSTISRSNMVSIPLKADFRTFIVLFVGLAAVSCSGRRPASPPVPVSESVVAAETDTTSLEPVSMSETIPIIAEVPVGQILNYDDSNFREPSSSFDIQHTTLALAFDFPGERVIGTAVHRLTSTVQLLTHLHFDARDMEIRRVAVKRPDSEFEEVAFQYNNADLTVSLQPGIGKTVALEVKVDYIAHPMRNGQDMGMVFVDGAGVDPSLPTQVWTLGQPEDNQFWFPSWDYPNDRMTFDMSLTVPQHFSTIANGDLIEQTALPDNLRRDRWVLNKPHVSYLAGFAAGEFAAAVDSYTRRDGSSVPLAYLVEPAYAQDAKLIFGETPAMMGFFERNLGIRYPWSNYKQVCVREFAAGGMENTTATIFYSELQHDRRTRHDFTGRSLITHELAHQWFGNLVSSRNWANLSLNEGFATYFERLYLEQAHGLAAAQKHTIDDRRAYLEEAKNLRRPIVWHGYSDPNEVFDRHTYQKAALVLHQLRFELGDEVWWRGVRQYLTRNAYKEVTIDDLQLAMEQASGKRLGGFFQQWYRRPGHPEIRVKHTYHSDHGVYELKINQIQDSLRVGTFVFNANIEVNIPGAAPWISQYSVTSRDTTFRFAIAGDISFVRFDPGDWILGEMTIIKSVNEWQNQARYDDEPAGRYDAVVALQEFEPNKNVRNVLLHVLQSDNVAFVRAAAAESLSKYATDQDVRPYLLRAIQSDSDAAVRRVALNTLSASHDESLKAGLDVAIKDESYQVIAEAVRVYAEAYPPQAIQAMRGLYDIQSWDNTVENAMIAAYARINAIEGIPYLQAHASPETEEVVQLASIEALAGIAQYNPDVRSSIAQFISEKIYSTNERVRLTAVQVLEPIFDDAILSKLSNRLPTEPSERVRQAIQRLVNIGN